MMEGTANLPYELDAGRIIVITHVPALVCEQCGDDFVVMDVVKRVEGILERLEHDGISMGFVEYEQAA
jgi:YgiT-type zinc finger domain-containing protein